MTLRGGHTHCISVVWVFFFCLIQFIYFILCFLVETYNIQQYEMVVKMADIHQVD